MDNRGQAFSAFKLLIAAVVAMALLGILMPIILKVMGILTTSPSEATKTLLSAMVDRPGSKQLTDEVTFQPGDVLAARTLEEGTAVSADQICLSLGGNDSGGFEQSERGFTLTIGTEGRQTIEWKGGAAQTARVLVACDRDSAELGISLGEWNFDDAASNCDDSCPASGKCCAVILQRAG